MVNVFKRHVCQNTSRFTAICFIYFLTVSLRLSDAISVNVQGSLTLGKEVMDMLTQYVGGDMLVLHGRRSMSTINSDYYTQITEDSDLCENLLICRANEFKIFIEEYVIMLGKAIESIFNVVTHGRIEKLESDTIFGAEFIKALKEIKSILTNADDRISDENEAYIWTGTMKKISSKLQRRVCAFTSHNLEGKTDDILNVRKKLDQKLILAIIAVEDTYLRKLCSHGICLKNVECTRTLSILLDTFKAMDERKAKEFVKGFQKELEDTNFYKSLKEETANEFQIVLSDMSNTDTVQAKEVLLSVQKSVDARLKLESSTHTITGGFDTKLVNTILSDLDYMYSKHKTDQFHAFLNSYYVWQNSASSIRPVIHSILKRLEEDVTAAHGDIYYKIITEVRIFLEITVDP